MSFDLKVDENKRIALKCKEIGAYNAGATRAYYSAFQRAKCYLTKNNFDYYTFLTRIGEKKERAFSHGTIQRAVIECLLANGKSSLEISRLGIWDNLYWKRIKADYHDKVINHTEMEACIKELETVLSVIN